MKRVFDNTLNALLRGKEVLLIKSKAEGGLIWDESVVKAFGTKKLYKFSQAHFIAFKGEIK